MSQADIYIIQDSVCPICCVGSVSFLDVHSFIHSLNFHSYIYSFVGKDC